MYHLSVAAWLWIFFLIFIFSPVGAAVSQRADQMVSSTIDLRRPSLPPR